MLSLFLGGDVPFGASTSNHLKGVSSIAGRTRRLCFSLSGPHARRMGADWSHSWGWSPLQYRCKLDLRVPVVWTLLSCLIFIVLLEWDSDFHRTVIFEVFFADFRNINVCLTNVKLCSWLLTLIFCKNNFTRIRGSFFAQNLRTIPASAEEQSLKF